MNAVVQRQEDLPVVQGGPVTPMHMLQIAVQQGADMEKLQKLMDLQERWEANEARKAFVAALNAFKADPPTLTKNKHVKFETSKGVTEYDHATLDNVSLTIGKALSKHGLSHRWDVDQLEGGAIKVTCVLTHCMGHSERVPMQSGADQSGGKNNIQALGSTVTYLQRYTLLAATGMATEEMDDDGHHTEERGLGESKIADFETAIADETDAAKLAELWKKIVAACNEAKDTAAYGALKVKVEARGKTIKEKK